MVVILRDQDFNMCMVLLYPLTFGWQGDSVIKCVEFFLMYICTYLKNIKSFSNFSSVFIFFKDFVVLSFDNTRKIILIH